MTVLTLTITDAGRNAMVNAANTGTLPLALDKVVLGRACYVPTATQLALHDPIKPLATFGGSLVADDTIHITITDDSFDTYSLGEIGLYSGEVLFAVYSQALPILEKGPEQMVLLSADIQFLSLPANSVTVGSTEFAYPQGNELRPGVLEIATPDEATTGKDHTRAITPLTLKQGLETKLGKLETAVAAVKLLSQRLLRITGNAVGQVGFDGSSDVEMNLTITPKMIGAVARAAATNWATADVIDAVVGLLSWRNYGNGHTIFDASAGLSPGGTLVDKTNAQIAWSGTFPTLMGWNGATTYGVRVDSARRADGATWADGAAYANKLDGDVITTIGRDLRFYGKRAMVGKGNNDGNQLVINYDNDFGSTAIQGDLYAGAVQSSRHAIIHNGATNYANAGLDVRSTDGSDVRIAMHRAGYSAGSIVHNSWGFTFERESAGSNANVGAGNFFANDAQSALGNALTRLDYVGANFLKHRNRLHPDDGTSLDSVNREYGFNYGTGGGSMGPYISFGGLGGGYDCQITAAYAGNGSEIKFRTRNGDANAYNPWHTFWNTGNFDPNTKLNTAGGRLDGQVYNSVNGVPYTFVGGKLSSESGTLSLDAYTYAFVTSPNDAHLCYNAHYQPSTGWQKYDNGRTSGVLVAGPSGLRYLMSDAGSANVAQNNHGIFHSGNLNPIEKNFGNELNNPGFGVGFLSSSDSGPQWIAGYFGKNGGANQVVIGENGGSAVIGAHNAAKNAWAELMIGVSPGGGGNQITHISMPYARVQGNATSYEVFHRGIFNPDAENRFVARGDAVDCNTAVANGHWRLTPSTANIPSATYGCMFTVSEGWGAGNGGAWLQQTAYMHDGTIWTRRSVNGGWAGWTRLWDSAGFNPDSKLSNNGSGGTLHLSDWFRSIGATGWYNETFEGGIYMDEPTTIKIHNGKKFYTANAEYNAIAATGGIFSYRGMSVDTRASVDNGNSFNAWRYSDAPFHAGFGGLNVGSFAPIIGSANYTNGYGYTTRIQFGALTQNGTGWTDAVIMVGSAENDAHPLAAYVFGADGHMRGLTALTLSGNANIGNDMTCSYAYANGAQPQVANALTRKDYVDTAASNSRWNTLPVIQHGGGDANAHYNSAWDGASVANAPSADWHFFRELYHSGGANWRHQEAFNFFSDEEWFRRGQNQAGDYGPWRRRWHSGNFDPATKSDVGHMHSSLATARTITLASELAGSASFDGSKDITINATTIKHLMFSGVSDSVTFSLAGAVGNTNSVIEVTILAGSGFAMGHLPLVTAKQYPSGYSMFVDYGDGEDFIFSWSYNSAANTVTLTNTGRGDFVRVVVTH